MENEDEDSNDDMLDKFPESLLTFKFWFGLCLDVSRGFATKEESGAKESRGSQGTNPFSCDHSVSVFSSFRQTYYHQHITSARNESNAVVALFTFNRITKGKWNRSTFYYFWHLRSYDIVDQRRIDFKTICYKNHSWATTHVVKFVAYYAWWMKQLHESPKFSGVCSSLLVFSTFEGRRYWNACYLLGRSNVCQLTWKLVHCVVM